MQITNNPMKKRGQVEIIIGAVVFVAVVGFGLIGTINSISENRYVVDISNGVIYDLVKCPISKINQTNLIYISDLNEEARKTLKEGSC